MTTASQDKLSDRARSAFICSQRSVRTTLPARVSEIHRSYAPISHIVSNQIHLDDRLDTYNFTLFLRNWRRTTHRHCDFRLEVNGKFSNKLSIPYDFLARCNSFNFNIRIPNQTKYSVSLFAKRFHAIKNLEKVQLTLDVSDQITSIKTFSKSMRLLSSLAKSIQLDIVDEGLISKEITLNEAIKLLHDISNSKLQSFGLNLMYSTDYTIKVLSDLLKTKFRNIIALDILVGEPTTLNFGFRPLWNGFENLQQLQYLKLAFADSYIHCHVNDGFSNALKGLKKLNHLAVGLGGEKAESEAVIAELQKAIPHINLEQFSLFFQDATIVCEESLRKLICSFSSHSIPQNTPEQLCIYIGKLELDFKREKENLILNRMLACPSNSAKSEGFLQNMLEFCDSATILTINFPEKAAISSALLDALSACIGRNKNLHELSLDLSLVDDKAVQSLGQVFDAAAQLNSLLIFSLMLFSLPDMKVQNSLVDHLTHLFESQPSLTAVNIDMRDLDSTIAHYSQITKALGTNRCLESLNLDIAIASDAFYDMKYIIGPLKKCPKLEVLGLYLKGGQTLGLTNGDFPQELNSLQSLGVFHLQIEDKSCSRKGIIEFFTGMRKNLVHQQSMNSIGLFLLAKNLPDFSTEELVMYKYRLSALKLPENWKKEYLVSIAGNFSLSIYYSLWRRK